MKAGEFSLYAAEMFSMTLSVTSSSLSEFQRELNSLMYSLENGDSNLLIMLYALLPFSLPSSAVVKPVIGIYEISSIFMKPIIASSVVFDLNRTFFFIQSAHSLAIAFCDNSFLSLISNSVPVRLRSLLSRGI